MKKIGNAFALLALAVFGLVFVGCGRKVSEYGEVDTGGLYVDWKGTDANWLGYATSEAPKDGYKIVTADFGFRYHCTAPAGYKHDNHKDHWVSPDNFKCYSDGKKCDRYVSTKLGGLLRQKEKITDDNPVEGTVAFEVPINAGEIKLVYHNRRCLGSVTFFVEKQMETTTKLRRIVSRLGNILCRKTLVERD